MPGNRNVDMFNIISIRGSGARWSILSNTAGMWSTTGIAMEREAQNGRRKQKEEAAWGVQLSIFIFIVIELSKS